MSSERPRYYPVSLDLRDREVAVVGGGWVAAEKIEGLIDAGARVRLIAARLDDTVSGWARHPRVVHVARDYEVGDLAGVFLVFCDREDPEIFTRVFREAEERKVFANVQDEVPFCSVIAPALFRQGDLQIAVSTSGSAPALAVRLKERFQRELGEHYADFLDLARRLRRPLKERYPEFAERRRRWYELVDSPALDLLARGERAAAERLIVGVMGVEPEEARGLSPGH